MKKYFKLILILLVFLVIGLFALKALGFKIYRYSPAALSMFPTISPGDICLCKMKENYKSGDIRKQMIVLLKHEAYDFVLTKRIIATEGDLIAFSNDTTYLNKTPFEEPYAFFSEIGNLDNNLNNIDSLRVDKDKVFVMGDNRHNSCDSRNPDFGLVNVKDIVGRSLFILWSKDSRKIGEVL